MDQSEKISTTATTFISRAKAAINSDDIERPTTTIVGSDVTDLILKEWPAMARKAAESTIKRYGMPNEATPSQMTWFNNGPWKRTIVHRHEIPHDFPQPHTDVIENVINYEVPVDKLTELGRFDGSLYVDRTRGEASARCDMEPANILSLNMMHAIVTGLYDAEQARKVFAETTAAFLMNRPAPYAESLQFPVEQKDTRFTDESLIGEAMLHQAGEKLKDTFTDNENHLI